MDNKNDIVNNPKHYKIQGLENETLDILLAIVDHNKLGASEGYILGNILKYLIRFNNKNGVEDLKKAEFYLKRLIKDMEPGHE